VGKLLQFPQSIEPGEDTRLVSCSPGDQFGQLGRLNEKRSRAFVQLVASIRKLDEIADAIGDLRDRLPEGSLREQIGRSQLDIITRIHEAKTRLEQIAASRAIFS
jgi:hypothetical protein